MLKFTRSSDLSLELYEQRINAKNYILVDKEKMQSAWKYEKSRMETNGSLARRTMKANAAYGYSELSKEAVLSYLVSIEKCPPTSFKKKGVESASIDMKKVLAPLYAIGFAKEFLGYYMIYSSLKSKCGRIEGTMKCLYSAGEKDRNGKDLYRLNFTVSQQENLRFNYKDQDLISIPKEYGKSFTVEDGYVLAWGDFASSDWRIAYNTLVRDERNAEIMDAYDDKYEGIARVVAKYYNEEFDLEKFKQERNLYKVYVLAAVYGQRKGDTPAAQVFISKFAKYLESCPRYMEYYTRIVNRCELGLPIPVTGYFGFDQFVPFDPRFKKDTINKSLNTPVQTGSSQIVILTCNEILNRFYELGYTEDDISIYIVRHDEPIFKISERAMKDTWIFNQASEIIVDNWTPLALSFNFGYNYLEEDQDLEDYVKAVYRDNMHKIDTFTPDKDVEPYWPVAETFTVHVGIAEVDDKTIVSIYQAKTRLAATMLLDTTNAEDIYNRVKAKLQEYEEEVFDKGYRGVVVYTELAKEEFFNNVMFFKVTNVQDQHKTFAQVLAHYMAHRYAEKYGKEFSANMDAINVNRQMILETGDLSVLQGQG
jgi:hypothetical protein